jgi:Flp pilus assembly pilin Flp
MVQRAKQLWSDERGQDLIEYALLAAFACTVGSVLMPRLVYDGISQIYSRVNSELARIGAF